MDCREETAFQTLATVRLTADHYVNDCGFDGVNVLSASGKWAQQSVPHMHFHIIPRKAGDGLDAWPHFKKENCDLEEIWKRLKFPTTEETAPQLQEENPQS